MTVRFPAPYRNAPPMGCGYQGDVAPLDLSGYLTGNQPITLSGDATGTGTTAITVELTDTGVSPGSYTNTNLTVDIDGRVTAAANGSAGTPGITQLTGDGTAGPGSGSQALTLATVNGSLGTFQGITVNAKGLVTAAINQGYLTANQTITLSGDLSGSGTTSINAQIAANAVGTAEIADSSVTYAKIQNVANNRVLGNTSGSAAAPSEIVLPLAVANGGTGLAAGTSGGIPAYTGATTIASSGVLTANGFVIGGGAGAVPAISTVRQSGTGNHTITTGVGASTEACGFELGGDRTGNGVATIDLHTAFSNDYEFRVIRNAGVNGSAQLINAGTGTFQLLNSAGVELSGTGTNNNATAGSVGEYIESNIPAASGTLATSAVVLNVTSISLAAGDWDVCGSVFTIPTAGCVLTDFRGGVSYTSGTLLDASRYAAWLGSLTNPSLGLTVPQLRISIAVTTVIYLVSYQTFTTAALRIAGTISARRAR